MEYNYRQISSCAQRPCQTTGSTINEGMHLRFHSKNCRRNCCTHAREAPAALPHSCPGSASGAPALTPKRRRSFCPAGVLSFFIFLFSTIHSAIALFNQLSRSVIAVLKLSRRSPCPTQRSCSCARRCRRCTHSRHGGTPHRRSHGRRHNPSRT